MTEFKSRAQQLEFVFGRFIEYVGFILGKAGLDGNAVDKVKNAPSLALLGIAMDMARKYGEGLRKEDMGTVFKLIIEQATQVGAQPEEITRVGTIFTDYLKERQEDKDKFFLFTRIIMDLLE
jgi:hypothetical protein